MLKGRYGDTSGRPYLQGHLSMPRLQLWANISFIVDSGADFTTLAPADGLRINLDYSQLQPGQIASGIGGKSQMFRENATLAFRDTDGQLHTYEIVLGILEPRKDIMSLPSLLGRDLLNRWRTELHPAAETLHLYL